jgi:hypothetical protein
VGVKLGIAGAAHPVAKGGAHKAPAAGRGVAVAPKAGERRLALQIAERGADGALVRFSDPIRGLAVTDRPQHADRLRRREGDVEAGHAVLAQVARQRLAAARIKGIEDRVELGALDLAGELELVGAGAAPAPRRLALARVVVLGAGGDRVQVIGLLAPAELADRDHLLGCGLRPPKVQVVSGIQESKSSGTPGGDANV